MKTHLYLSLLPEALVASHLSPEEFGTYMATGTQKQPHGPAMFFEVEGGFQSDFLNVKDLDARCRPHADGRPKNSLYLAIYRVLEHVPLAALGSLWLTTAHGRSLQLTQAAAPADPAERHNLYRELVPVQPLIASDMGPVEFTRFITDPSKGIYVPRICFAEMALGGLREDPLHGRAGDLPYRNIDHIRHCLAEMKGKATKTVERISAQGIIYRCVRRGFFVGDQQKVLFYPYPSREELEGKYHSWWSCANDNELSF
jgi:hypothetical protein